MKLGVRIFIGATAVLMAGGCSASEEASAAREDHVEVATVEEAAVAQAAVFPESFRGNWDYNENGCKVEDSGTRFKITENQIVGYEETSTLVSVEVLDELGIKAVLNHQSADGDQRIEQIMYLSPVAGISMRIQNGEKSIRTLRCDPV